MLRNRAPLDDAGRDQILQPAQERVYARDGVILWAYSTKEGPRLWSCDRDNVIAAFDTYDGYVVNS